MSFRLLHDGSQGPDVLQVIERAEKEWGANLDLQPLQLRTSFHASDFFEPGKPCVRRRHSLLPTTGSPACCKLAFSKQSTCLRPPAPADLAIDTSMTSGKLCTQALFLLPWTWQICMATWLTQGWLDCRVPAKGAGW